MLDKLKSVSAEPVPCKICDGAAALYGVVDFHKSCEDHKGRQQPLSGVPIYYRRCEACGFLFTDAFDAWSADDFKAHIYNAGYAQVDPDYASVRPKDNAGLVSRLWGPYKEQTRVLDYGGGNDVLCAELRAFGFPAAVTYDPMVPEFASRPTEKFDLVTSFETLEHLPDPHAGIATIVECLAETGVVFFSTCLQPIDLDQHRLNWWYVGPRNGHVSIFSKQALTAAWTRHGCRVVSFSANAHLAFRKLPPYLAHLDK